MSTLKIKIITGFRGDQFYIIDSEEAHKAYFLFNNPEARTVFSNGVALIGKNIQGIEPAWNETMGWNQTHKLDDDDWNQIRKLGKEKEMKITIEHAKEVAQLSEQKPDLLKSPMDTLKLL